MRLVLPYGLLCFVGVEAALLDWRLNWPFAASSVAEHARTSHGSRFKEIVCFGDSLSDDGHGSFALTNGTWPPSQYWHGRYSDGPTWIEETARMLATPLRNYAVGGATSDNDLVRGCTGVKCSVPSPSMVEQVDAYIASEVGRRLGRRTFR
jgi:phospholipase/lecithinase/hemolysin